MDVHPGEVVAIVLAGSGKTTLGRYKSYGGYRLITLDGEELRIRTDQLREKLAAVRQDIQLFSAFGIQCRFG